MSCVRASTFIGVVIGLNATFIAICTEWLSDIKLGHCSYAWWLNQKFCCWGVESEGNTAKMVAGIELTDENLPYLIRFPQLHIDGYCDDWSRWSRFEIIDYVFYLAFAVRHAYCCLREGSSTVP